MATPSFEVFAPAWALCVEAAFYLMLPAIAASIGWLSKRFGRGVEVGSLLTLGIASAALHVALHAAPGLVHLGFSLPGLFLWFSLGMLLATASVDWEQHPPRLLRIMVMERAWVPWSAGVGAYLLVAYGLGLPPGPCFPPLDQSPAELAAEHVLYGLAALGLLLPAVFGGEAAVGRVECWLSRRWLGSDLVWDLPLARSPHLRA